MNRIFISFISGCRYVCITCSLVVLLFLFHATNVYAQSDGLPRGSYQMPYTRYEAAATSLGGGATLLGPTFDQKKVESEASDQVCASLAVQNSFVRWNLSQAGQGMVLRFSMPDAGSGGGLNGSLALYVGGTFVQNISLTSKWAWQYFSPNPGDGTKDPTNTPSPGWTARMRFDEVRVKLPASVAAGTEIRLQKTANDGITYIVDFIEMEPIPAAITQPANSLSVIAYGATANDQTDDMMAFINCANDARTQGRTMYIPSGRFLLGSQGGKWSLIGYNNLTVQGAGMWHTELYFTNPSPNNGGIETGGTGLHFRDFYMNTENTNRTLPYKGFTGGYGTNSSIERVWAEHFEVGAWIANWSSSTITDGLLITGCRFRNNYADGVNFSKGTSNSICEHSHFRNNGDDAMASWSSFDGTACINNEFRYCTAENTWRAGGIGFFGGGGHKGHHLLIKDCVETGIRVNSDFPGPEFSTTLWMEIYETTVISAGTNANLWFNRYGAIDIFTRLYNLQNLRLRNVNVLNSQKDAIMIYTVNPSFRITNLELINVTVDGAGRDNNVNNYTSGTYDDYAGHGLLVLPNVSGSMTTQNLVITNAPTAAIKNESSATFTINTIGNVPVTGVSISPTTAVSIPQGGTAQLNAVITPGNATNQNVTWTSSNTSVATINATGLVTGAAPGTATITVRTQDGNFTATKAVTVAAAVNITAPDTSAGEGGNAGTFTIATSSTATNITVGYAISGTATSADYSSSPSLSGSVTLTPSSPSVTITISPAEDTNFEGTESLTLTLQPGSGYNLGGNTTATISIADNDSPPCTAPVIGFTSTAPVIDQSIDAVWSNVPAGAINNVTFGSRPGDFTGSQWRALYTNSHLYVLVEVKDNARFNDSGTSWWEDDVVEVFIDGDNSKGAAYDGINDFQYGFRYNDPSSVKVGQNSVNRTADISYAIQNVSNGYNIEVAIPWSTIGVTRASGDRIGLEISVDDDDNGGVRDAQMSAFSTNGQAFASPSVFGSVVLTTSCGGGQIIPVTGVTVSPASATLSIGGTQQLVETVSPSNATNKNVSWTTSNASVATVSSGGLVTAVSAGSATITVTTQDGNKTATASITVNTTTQTPYPNGTPWPIPGTIEVENFDNGGEGVAFHDVDAVNSGGQGRTSLGVDTETCSEGGLNVGWTATGEWLEYTVNVANAGNYNIEVRVASVHTGGTFHIEFNGVDKTGIITTINTGAWQTWASVTKANVALSAGQQVMRIYYDNANFNLNKVIITPASGDPAGVITCYRAPGAITVNGSLTEPGWNVTRAFSKATIGSPNNTATFGVLWDNTNLYIGARVLDSNLFSDSPEGWNDDAVEIYIDANNNKLASYDGLDNQVIKNYNKSSVYTRLAITGLQHAWASVSGGYSIEVAIPWSQLGISAPVQGTTLGFDIGYDDDDNGGSRETQAVWNGTVNNYQNTSAFGSLVLNSTVSSGGGGDIVFTPEENETLREEQSFTVAPNPATQGVVNVHMPSNTGVAYIQVINMNGKTVRRHQLTGREGIVDLSQEPKGIYLLRARLHNRLISRKVIIE